MRNAFVHAVMKLAESDPQLMLVSGDLGYHFFEEFRDRFPEQFLNTGICEQSMAGIAAGLALTGKRVFMYSIGNFPTMRCMEQIRNDICYHSLPVCIVNNGGGMAYGYLGMSHHGTEDLSAMRLLPEMRVAAPADPREVSALTGYFYRHPGPAFLRMNRGGEMLLHQEALSIEGPVLLEFPENPQAPEVFIIGTGEIASLLPGIREGLASAGIAAGISSCPIIKPLPELTMKKSVKLLVTLEENNIIGGLGGAAAEQLSASGSHPPLLRLGMPDCYCSVVGKQNFLRESYGLSVSQVVQRIIGALRT